MPLSRGFNYFSYSKVACEGHSPIDQQGTSRHEVVLHAEDDGLGDLFRSCEASEEGATSDVLVKAGHSSGFSEHCGVGGSGTYDIHEDAVAG
jgi:hypothetical protein